MASKTKRDGGGGGSGGWSSQKKAKYMQGNGPAAHEFSPGLRGALITCDVHLEREAIKETYRLFEAVIEAEAPPAAAAAGPRAGEGTSSNTAGDALAAELAELQGETNADNAAAKPKPQLSIAQTGCNGSVFVRFDKAVALDPVTLVDRVMERAKAGAAGARAPHVIRMLPVQSTCPARTADCIAEAAEPLIAAALSNYKGTYSVQWRRRCNGEIDKMSVINALAAAVNKVAPEATVDLANADAAIVAEVIKTTCSLAVLPRWREFDGYNLRTVSGGVPPQPSAKEKAAREEAAAVTKGSV